MKANLLKGTLEIVVLEIISDGTTYGYEIAQRIRRETDGRLIPQDGTMYPCLHRLEQRGYLHSTWGKSKTGRDRKHYRLTPAGRKRLDALRREWGEFSTSVDRLLKLSFDVG
jgi:transcriptional regulator